MTTDGEPRPKDPLTRRGMLVAATGVLAALAGCSDEDDVSNSGPPPCHYNAEMDDVDFQTGPEP